MSPKTTALCALLAAASCTDASAAPAEPEWGGTASGKGRIAAAGAESQTHEAFEAKFAMAIRQGEAGGIWLLVSDAEAPGHGWAAAGQPIEILRQWCEYEDAKWVLYELDSAGVPQLAHECGSAGSLSTSMISTINGLASVAPTWEVFDGKHARGRIRSGSGSCGDDYCEARGDYTVDTPIVDAPVIGQ